MAYRKEYYEKNKEKYYQAQKKYIEKKKLDEDWLAKKAEYMKEYYSTHEKQRLAKNEYNKKYRLENKDYFRRKAAEYKERDKKKEEVENEE